jgi:translation initiation factor IF-3
MYELALVGIFYNKTINKRFRFNNFIKAEQLRVVDNEGKNLGVFLLAEALQMAKDQGLDLIEITANANPPVAKITDLGKMIYRQDKEERKQRVKQKKDDLKRIRLSFKMGQHDLEVRRKKIEEFLKESFKIQVEMFLRGREKSQKELAKQKLQQFLTTIKEEYKIAGEIKQAPNNFSVVISK